MKVHNDNCGWYEGLHPHEARALELDEIGESRRAAWIRRCVPLDERTGAIGEETCKTRACPSCAQVLAKRWGRAMARSIASMKDPHTFTLFIGRRPVAELHRARRDLRTALSELRRVLLSGTRIVGSIEPQIIADGDLCNAHAHLVSDGPPPYPAIKRAWGEITAAGTMTHETDARVRDAHALAAYLAHPSKWCPRSGALPLRALKALFDAIHGQQLRIDWMRQRTNPERERRRSFAFHDDEPELVDEALLHSARVIRRRSRSTQLAFIAANYVLDTHEPHSKAWTTALAVIGAALKMRLVLVEPSRRSTLAEISGDTPTLLESSH